MEKKSLKSFLWLGVIPLLVIIFAFKMNKNAGILCLLAYLAFLLIYNSSVFYQIKGQTEYNKGNIQMAEKWFKKAAESVRGRNNSYMLVSYGYILFKEGKLKEAEEILMKAVDKSKGRDDRNMAKSNLALVVWKKGDLDKAFRMLKEVTAEYKTSAVYGSLGYLAIEKGDLDEALKINLEAYDFNSDNAVILDNLAHLYHMRGEMDRAGEMFKKLMQKEPHFPEAYYDYGKYLEDAGEPEKAAEMYQRALKCKFNFNNTITAEQVRKDLERLTQKSAEN